MNVDWASLPLPQDDGTADHLLGMKVPSIPLPSTDGETVMISTLAGKTVLYIYPRTGRPGEPNPEGWDATPG